MTNEEIIAVVQAHTEGKQIQYRKREDSTWKDVDEPHWAFNISDYRVKPEEKHSPFQTIPDVLRAIDKHGSFIKPQSNGSAAYQIQQINRYSLDISVTISTGLTISAKSLMDNWVFAKDNTPCRLF